MCEREREGERLKKQKWRQCMQIWCFALCLCLYYEYNSHIFLGAFCVEAIPMCFKACLDRLFIFSDKRKCFSWADWTKESSVASFVRSVGRLVIWLVGLSKSNASEVIPQFVFQKHNQYAHIPVNAMWYGGFVCNNCYNFLQRFAHSQPAQAQRTRATATQRWREIHTEGDRHTNQFSSENPIDATVISPTMKWHKMKANDSTIPMQYAQAPKHTYANYGIDIFIVVKIYALFSLSARCCCCCLWKSFTAETL